MLVSWAKGSTLPTPKKIPHTITPIHQSLHFVIVRQRSVIRHSRDYASTSLASSGSISADKSLHPHLALDMMKLWLGSSSSAIEADCTKLSTRCSRANLKATQSSELFTLQKFGHFFAPGPPACPDPTLWFPLWPTTSLSKCCCSILLQLKTAHH